MQASRQWDPGSWRQFAASQQPQYPSEALVQEITYAIREFPPLVFSGEVDALIQQISEAQDQKRFLLQGGDCAEAFADCRPDLITNKLKILLQMSLVLCYGAKCPVIRVGRIAGQYAKPRSSDFEQVGDQRLPSYRGDIINGIDATLESRIPDPKRMLQSYHHASMTLNFIRALIAGGFADLHHPEHWDLSFLNDSQQRRRYEQVVGSIRDAVSFVGALGGIREERLGSVDFFTSHEGLLLPYEEALTRQVGAQYYNLGAHMLWIGDRTRNLDGAHIEYFRGIANPIGIKIGPSTNAHDLVQLLGHLNPQQRRGRMVLITRFGAGKVSKYLPPLIAAVKESKSPVLWSCDPMHGNTRKASGDLKTRDFQDILQELRETFDTHQQHGCWLGGVHFELTGEDVTECIGGATGLKDSDLARNYVTYCDPRLNYTQSLEMAFLISSMLRDGHMVR